VDKGGTVTDIIERLAAAMNQHDLDGAVSLMHEDYRSEQPAHPGRAFLGRAQMRANWEAMFAGVPDFRGEVLGSVQDGAMTWTEWHWSGTRTDGLPLNMRGVTLFETRDGQIVAGRLYMEDVEREAIGIADTVESISGQQPRSVQE
jgi:ketosteroid isomerase-like protein